MNYDNSSSCFFVFVFFQSTKSSNYKKFSLRGPAISVQITKSLLEFVWKF